MNTRSARALAAVAVIGLIATGALSGCTTAKAESIDLTYYYLPG